MLKKLGIVKTKNKGYKVFMEHIAPDFLDNSMIPSEYVKFLLEKIRKLPVCPEQIL